MSASPDTDPLVTRTFEILDTTTRAADAYGRADLLERLEAARTRLHQTDMATFVVGEFKKGKSTLVNALLNAEICPVSDELATVVPTTIRHGAEVAASVWTVPAPTAVPGAGPDPVSSPADTEFTAVTEPESTEARNTGLERRTIPVSDIATWASEQGNLDNSRAIRAVEVELPRTLLVGGLTVTDTPGVGGLHSMHGAATMAVLDTADVVIFVTDASQELSRMELDFMRTSRRSSATLICVMTKIDLHPAWRRIVDLNRGHLDRAGLDEVPLIPVSSLLRQQATAAGSRELNEESGYPPLVRLLRDSVISRARRGAVTSALSSALFVLDQIDATFVAEREVLTDPDAALGAIERHRRAQERAEQLRTVSARWQQTLSDGGQDLSSEVEHDLRHRIREILNLVDETFEAGDPLDVWDEFSQWLRRQVAGEVAGNASVLREAANALAQRVSEHFALDEHALAHVVEVGSVPRIDGSIDASFEDFSIASGALTAMRGSYGGILMFGMIGQVAGLALLNPVTAVVGIGLGRKAYRDEKKRQLTMRQQQAKQAARKFLDDVSFAVTKEGRDAIRRVQRDLRDEFTDRADQLQRSTREALTAAETARKQDDQERARRLAEIDQEMGRIATVRRAAHDVIAACGEETTEVAA